MKKKFSTTWKASKQPRKQRKYRAKAPLHIKRKLLSVNLSKELRKKYGKRNLVIRKGDSVLIKKGKFKGSKGKILEVKTRFEKIYVDGMNVKKSDGSKVNVPLKASNLQIIELNLDDGRRLGKKTIKERAESKNKEEKIK